MVTLRIRAVVRLVGAAALAASPAAAQAGWPGFGKASGESSDQAAESASADEAMIDSPMFQIGWPKLEMPKFSWKPGHGGDSPAPTAPQENPVSRALDKVAATSKRAADGVRGAWGSAVQKLSFGSEKASQTAAADQGGFWSKVFGAPESDPAGSETVQEFIAQERVGMRR